MGLYDTTIKALLADGPGRRLRKMLEIDGDVQELHGEFVNVVLADEAVLPKGGIRVSTIVGNGSRTLVHDVNGRVDFSNSNVLFAQSMRVDYLAEGSIAGRPIVHLEFQSCYDASMPMRMLAYRASIENKYGGRTKTNDTISRDIRQFLINVGSTAWTGNSIVQSTDLRYAFKVLDLCLLPPESLLGGDPNDTVLAILGRAGSESFYRRAIIRELAALPEQPRIEAFTRLLVLARLRNAQRTLEAEMTAMGVRIDFEDSRFLSEPIERAYSQGSREKEIEIVVRRFPQTYGMDLAPSAVEGIRSLDADDLELLLDAVLDAVPLDELPFRLPTTAATDVPSDDRGEPPSPGG